MLQRLTQMASRLRELHDEGRLGVIGLKSVWFGREKHNQWDKRADRLDLRDYFLTCCSSVLSNNWKGRCVEEKPWLKHNSTIQIKQQQNWVTHNLFHRQQVGLSRTEPSSFVFHGLPCYVRQITLSLVCT